MHDDGVTLAGPPVTGKVYTVDVTVTQAQLRALFTTRISLVPAPPAGQYINPLWLTGRVSGHTAVFPGANIGVTWSAAGTVDMPDAQLKAMLSGAGAAQVMVGNSLTAIAPRTVVQAGGVGLFLTADADYSVGAGTGTLSLRLFYTLEATT